jgi:hypothetical protein
MRGSREEQSEDRHRQSPPRRRWGWERDGRVRTAQTAPRVTRGSSGCGGQGGWFGNLLRRVARGCSVGAHVGRPALRVSPLRGRGHWSANKTYRVKNSPNILLIFQVS